MAHDPSTSFSFVGTGTRSLGDGSDAVASQIAVQLSGTFSATITWEGTVDGTNYLSVLATDATTGAAATTSTAPSIVRIDATGLKDVRANCSAYTSGTVVGVFRPVIG